MDAVLYDERDAVATITLNRPDSFNSVDTALFKELMSALETATAGPARAIVLTGAGRAFCAGVDLKELEAGYRAGDTPQLGRVVEDTFNPLLRTLMAIPKPVIAAVNGPSAGAGMGLALAADLRIMSSSASFMMAFINIGLVPDTGTSWLLPALVGYGRAVELTMSGRKIAADEALAIGLVNRVVDPDALAAEAHAWAAKLAAGPTIAYGRTKAMLRRAVETDLATALDLERDEQQAAGRTADHIEGVQAFLAKRPPVYQGR